MKKIINVVDVVPASAGEGHFMDGAVNLDSPRLSQGSAREVPHGQRPRTGNVARETAPIEMACRIRNRLGDCSSRTGGTLGRAEIG